MNKTMIGSVLLAGIVGTFLFSRAFAQASPAAADDYKLVWSDEFKQDGPLNPSDWGYEKGFVRNQELQWYQPANAVCAHGELVIEARREAVANPNFDAASRRWQNSRKESEYTSASVTTRGHHAWLYGRFEIKARIDTDSGSWPAFWMLGTSRTWPACGEIDIMEYYRQMVLANVAWGATGRDIVWNSVRKPLASFKDAAWSSKFHTWRMDWDKESLALYVDGELRNRQDLSKTINGTINGGNAQDNPFHRPMYLILNQAIGGQQGGDPSKSAFPMKFEVAYVKVWQRPSESAATQAGG